LVGASGSGKSTFAAKHFKPTEVLSSDWCRAAVSDDPNDQAATKDAFELLHFIAAKRLRAMKLTVIDATNVQPESRKLLIELARSHDALPVAIVFDVPERLSQERNRTRPDRDFGPHVVRQQAQQLRRSMRGMQREGLRYVWTLSSVEEIDATTITRQRLWTDRRDEHGPFDIIGDIHGCYDELVQLLERLGYIAAVTQNGERSIAVTPPTGRRAVFLGDLVDRGPNAPDVLRLVMAMIEEGTAICVPGNHEAKLLRKLRGKDVQLTHGLAQTVEQLDRETPAFRERVAAFIDKLISHFVLDAGKLVVAHGGMKAEYAGRASGRVREFALYGDTTGETDEFGLPVRLNWAADYRGRATVVYGHTPVREPEWLNNTINVDTGCVFGGALTALRYPERELVSVPAAHTYYEPARPFLTPEEHAPRLTAQQRHDELLDLEDVIGKRIVTTRLAGKVTIREENASAALEAMSRFAADPRWLVYLPPTMSPSETSALPGVLEHPAEAFGYYRGRGVARVVCEEKHMGSRAIVIVCRDAEAAERRFGLRAQAGGIVYTRTGRPFFTDAALEAALLERLRAAVTSSGLWEELNTDWLLLDCELMPWSLKAQELIQQQYAPVAAAARADLAAEIDVLQAGSDPALTALADKRRGQLADIEAFSAVYRRYTWDVAGVGDLRLAPFHLLASHNRVHSSEPHSWHLERLQRLAAADPDVIVATPSMDVDLADPASEAAAVEWWLGLTERGGEGMVVKPMEFVARWKSGLVQPALKVRGREYLRLIYGPDYTQPEHLERLRQRGLGTKRSLAMREFALGLEGLERFVHDEPLRRVHECTFAVLALESEPVDPRL
ncbi:MAG: polynucleotide kinase-phosphatase, partial [Chloroflexota bacterium]|nr:polynucleotide kinase-phosphatase [Chloroflexota bacterium]